MDIWYCSNAGSGHLASSHLNSELDFFILTSVTDMKNRLSLLKLAFNARHVIGAPRALFLPMVKFDFLKNDFKSYALC